MKPRVVIASLFVVAVLAGCRLMPVDPATAAPPPIPPGAGAASWTTEELQTARALYINKCTRCHKFHDPANYTDDKWDGWMKKMSHKARLKTEQEAALSRYLELFRSDLKTPQNR